MGPIEAIASNSPAVPVFEVVFTFPPFCSPHAASLKTLQSVEGRTVGLVRLAHSGVG
jgi:hypothetical protein